MSTSVGGIGKWVSLGIGAACIGTLTCMIRNGIKQSKATELTLHTNPIHYQFINADSDIEYIMRKLLVYRDHAPVTFDSIIENVNTMLEYQYQCHTNNPNYRTFGILAQEKNVTVILALENLGRWIKYHTHCDPPTEFNEINTELLTKMNDIKHNLSLVLFS